jgi:hypothetical protein
MGCAPTALLFKSKSNIPWYEMCVLISIFTKLSTSIGLSALYVETARVYRGNTFIGQRIGIFRVSIRHLTP